MSFHTIPEIVGPQQVWAGAWREDYQVFDYARLGLEFLAGHLPNAQLVDKGLVWTEVEGVAGMLPPPSQLEERLGAAGFDPAKPALVYDGGNSLYASRLAWALATAGWDRVFLLDGGLAAWRKAGFPVVLGAGQKLAPTRVSVPVRRELYATWLDVSGRSIGTVLLDTRSREEFTGRDRRSKRAGRIPGAIHWEWKRALAADGLSFRPVEELAAEFTALGVTAETPVITYCQSGVRAAHTLAALQRAGVRSVRNYDGSWEEWGNRDDLPLVSGEVS